MIDVTKLLKVSTCYMSWIFKSITLNNCIRTKVIVKNQILRRQRPFATFVFVKEIVLLSKFRIVFPLSATQQNLHTLKLNTTYIPKSCEILGIPEQYIQNIKIGRKLLNCELYIIFKVRITKKHIVTKKLVLAIKRSTSLF